MTTTDQDIIAETVRVPMRDGVEISVHVYRPASGEPMPALMSYTPYRKGRLGAAPPFVRHGYAAVFFDIRGTGDSGGWNDCIYCDAERQDGYDMVEWIAAQPWCSGNVGMYGISYGAVAALQMAMAAPPHLKAIIARSGSDDPYTEWTNPGGQPRTYMYECYSTIMAAFNFSPPDPEVVGERWEELWDERLRHNVPWGISFLENVIDGPFWRARALRDHYDRVRCAVYVVDGWADWYASPLLRIFSKLDVPKRALIGPWSHQFPDAALPGPRIDWDREMRRWFDCRLKGIDTGITDEPPVILFTREYGPPAPLLIEDHGRFQAAADWPPPGAADIPLFLHPEGRLDGAMPDAAAGTLVSDVRAGAATGMHGGGPFNDNWAMPLDQRADEPFSLTFTGEPLAEAVEAIGNPRMRLRFTCDREAALFAVKLCDTAPDGTAVLVTKGWLNASHRRSHADPEPLTPGAECEVEVELLSCAYRFAPGHRVRVMLAGADFLNVWPLPYRFTCEILPGSRLLLPVLPPGTALPAPELGASPHPLPRLEELEAPAVSITRDLIGGKQTLQYTATYGRGKAHTARCTVDPADPAHVVLEADANFHYVYPEREIDVRAVCRTTSDDTAFEHTAEVTITVNGQPHFSKRWATTVPRRLM